MNDDQRTGPEPWSAPVSRRSFLGAAAVTGAGLAVSGRGLRIPLSAGSKIGPGSRPHPRLPEGTDTIPQIEHIIVLMMENHSFDNYLGVLGRGDGFRLDKHGRPRDANPDASGHQVRAFHMPSTCQLAAEPSQSWNATHISMDGRRNDGFVKASGPVAMGYWTGDDVPFYYGLARTFVLCDRWFASSPSATFANRRFLLAATASGHTNNDFNVNIGPPNGTIFERLNAHGISWRDYYTNLPSPALFPSTFKSNPDKLVHIEQYFPDAAAGKLPAFSLIEPDFEKQSEENPQDIRIGEQFAARVINAAMHGPAWSKTLLVWCYDEHGGYYDHVPPPRAVAPDSTPPNIHVPPDEPGAYNRYGFRVPAVVISPRARRHHVSHVVYDHTSILKLVETKWNLPALTNRDAHAADLLDCIDLHSPPAFREPPSLPEPSLTKNSAACTPLTEAMLPSV